MLGVVTESPPTTFLYERHMHGPHNLPISRASDGLRVCDDVSRFYQANRRMLGVVTESPPTTFLYEQHMHRPPSLPISGPSGCMFTTLGIS